MDYLTFNFLMITYKNVFSSQATVELDMQSVEDDEEDDWGAVEDEEEKYDDPDYLG